MTFTQTESTPSFLITKKYELQYENKLTFSCWQTAKMVTKTVSLNAAVLSFYGNIFNKNKTTHLPFFN